VDLVTTSGSVEQESPRGPYRQELLYALRSSQDNDTAIWNAAPALDKTNPLTELARPNPRPGQAHPAALPASLLPQSGSSAASALPHPQPSSPGIPPAEANRPSSAIEAASSGRLPELIGYAPCMLEVSRRIRLVAPRSTPVLIEGPTGSGKELVAEALHRLSPRSRKPFVAINCAAIPEALLEAELFGHTRGAFTGAVQGRTGRIEAADGGTLFLDEIGEMPLALQSKLLRFVECGELQRVGDNETVKVDVRIVTATHQPLAQQTQAGAFRADLYYRLAVFLIRTPSLAEHRDDLPLLVNHFLARMGREAPVKRIDQGALAKLAIHDWPGNVRELEHVLERGAILAGEEAVLTSREIDFGLTMN
jgi:DNA-binding NtrC family response regulator